MDKSIIKDNRGMTMTEVLLAFAILSIIMGLLSGIIAFSKKMYMEAADQRRAQEILQKNVYMKKFDSVSDLGADVTEGLPIYRVYPVKDAAGLYDIALVKKSTVGGKTTFSTESGFPKKAVKDSTVTMAKKFAQIRVSDWVAEEERSSLGDFKEMNFILFNK